MERGSTQHGARLDDELAEGVDALVTGAAVSARDREELDPEAPDADEIDLGGEGEHEVVIERSELARFLLPSTFPGTAAALIDGALAEQAPDAVVARLASLDPRTTFETLGEVWLALGHDRETRATVAPIDEPHAEPDGPDESQVTEARIPSPTFAPEPEPLPRSVPARPHTSAVQRVLRLPVSVTVGAVRGAVDAAMRVLLDE